MSNSTEEGQQITLTHTASQATLWPETESALTKLQEIGRTIEQTAKGIAQILETFDKFTEELLLDQFQVYAPKKTFGISKAPWGKSRPPTERSKIAKASDRLHHWGIQMLYQKDPNIQIPSPITPKIDYSKPKVELVLDDLEQLGVDITFLAGKTHKLLHNAIRNDYVYAHSNNDMDIIQNNLLFHFGEPKDLKGKTGKELIQSTRKLTDILAGLQKERRGGTTQSKTEQEITQEVQPILEAAR